MKSRMVNNRLKFGKATEITVQNGGAVVLERAVLPATIFCRFFRDLVTATFSEVSFEGPLLLEFYGTIP